MMYDLLKVNDEGEVVATGHFDVENVDRHWLLQEDLVSISFIFIFNPIFLNPIIITTYY